MEIIFPLENKELDLPDSCGNVIVVPSLPGRIRYTRLTLVCGQTIMVL